MKFRISLPILPAVAIVAVQTAVPALQASSNEIAKTPCMVRSASDSPLGLVHRFEQAYECGDYDAYAQLFTGDFRFFTEDPEVRAQYPDGMTREDELDAARHLFFGNTKQGGEHVPLAVKIDLRFDSLAVVDDPEYPGSPWQHRVVIAFGVSLVIDVGGSDELVSLGERDEFYVVRGEVADLGAGQAPDADHWYLRKWIERVKLAPPRWTTWGPIRAVYR